VNLLPYLVFQSLNLEKLKPTSVTLLLADWLVLKTAFLSRFYIIILHLKYQ
jgi:hypothetical protein